MRSLEFNMQRKYVTNNKLTVINIEKPLKLEEKKEKPKILQQIERMHV